MKQRNRLTTPSPTTMVGTLAIALAASACGAPATPRVDTPPVVVGAQHDALPPRVRGLVLLGELGCTNCHAQGDGEVIADARRGPDLASLETRVRGDYVERFLADPHAVEPGTGMPDLLRDLEPTAKRRAATALSHYVRSFATANRDDEPNDTAAAARGRTLFAEIGCSACHAPRDEHGKELPLPGSEPLGDLTSKYSMAGLRGFLLAPHDARPAARMPDFHLSRGDAHDLACFLVGRAAPTAPLGVDPREVETGRELFATRRCTHCHDLPDPARAPIAKPKPLRELDPGRGCLSATPGSWPHYPLSTVQRSDLVTALSQLTTPLAAEDAIRQRLAARNCTACHARDGLDGASAERSAWFTTSEPNLGADSRLPPTLSGVGAKLQPAWLHDAIAHGQHERPYLRTRMPGFGAAFAGDLAPLLAATDELPPLDPTPLPDDEKAAREVRELGRALVGDRGMNCIACHTFAGEQAGSMGAIDLVATTAARLRPAWFAHFLRAPFRFKPDTLMPQFFPGGVSTRPELGGGDATRQIEALWHYLAEGRNVQKPDGMRRPPLELVVDDSAVLLRRSVQGTGKRGISVGYPHGVNVTFDAESLALDQIWWGRFADAAPVWTGQGSGQVRILGKERAALPKGPAFVVATDDDAPWPDASRRDLGHRFVGYDLDAQQRPTFRYTCGDVAITDTPRELPPATAAGMATLRRTFTFASDGEPRLLFRAALGPQIDERGAGVVQVSGALRLRLPDGSFRIRAVGEQRELLVRIALVQGRAELTIDYEWLPEGR